MKQISGRIPIFLLVFLMCMTASVYAGQTVIELKADDSGRQFEGWGALSAGATSVFLRDYPEPYRSDILDYLFKPKFGLGIQHLKVEIGSGIDSTCGAEPSHAITPEELKNPVPRGYELWLAAEARKRNPGIILDALPWGTPYWTKDFTTKEAADWVVAFLDVAKKYYGLDFQYVGGSQNELLEMRKEAAFGRPFEFVRKHLRPALDKAGYQDVKIQMADHYNMRHNGAFKWRTTTRIMADPELMKIVDVIGYHYPIGYGLSYADCRPMPEGFLETGKPHWASEDYAVLGGAFSGGHNYMGRIIREYDELRMTKSIAWAPFTSMPVGFAWHNVGFLDASNCWNGHYAPCPALWCMAQLTQFVEPGWTYMDSTVKSCGNDPDGTMHMALKAPNGKDWSLIAVTGKQPAVFNIRINDEMNRKTVHVWKSNQKEQMVKQENISPKDGTFTLKLSPDSIYTLTTTTGQTKGQPPHPVPPAVPGGPWKDDLKNCKVHDKVKYWGDYEGTFEIAKHEGRNVMKQMVPRPGCKWHRGLHGACIAIYGGCDAVTHFSMKAEVKIQDGFIGLGGRLVRSEVLIFKLDKTGKWNMLCNTRKKKNTKKKKESPETITSVMAEGQLDNFDPEAWHQLEMSITKDKLCGWINGRLVVEEEITGRNEMTIAITSSYHHNMLRNIEVVPEGEQ